MPASTDKSVASERFRVRLPAEPTDLIGRDDDVARIEALLDAGGVATIVGAPGIGKTRVALRLAHRAAERGWFCDLSQADDRAGLCAAVAAGLGVPLGGDPIESLGHRIAALGNATIVLDNYEQLVAHAAETLEPWMAAAPAARFVVTSRERLRLRAEHVIELSPLGEHALALLIDRVRATRPEFSPGAEERAALETLVVALEGIPLAIELAAARIDVLGVDGVLSRLPKQLEVLSRGSRDAAVRQATLRDAIAWSWDLLDDPQRRALARCAVFRGGFGVDAAEAVIADGALDMLQDLRERSLLRTAGAGRFSLYESIRAYAAERLAESGERDAAEAAHSAFYVAYGEERVARFQKHGGAIDELVAERHNLLAVTERAIAAGDAELAVRAALALGPVLATRGPVRFHLELLERIALLRAPDARLLHARAMAYDAIGARAEAARDLRAALAAEAGGYLEVAIHKDLGLVHHHLRQIDEAQACYEAALIGARAIGARRLEGMIVGNLGALEHDVGGFEQAALQYRQALDVLREVGDARLEGIFMTNLGVLEQEEGRSDSARRHYLRALELLDLAGDARFEAITLGNLGVLEHAAGALDEARARHSLALDLLHEVGDVRSEALSAARLGAVLAQRGEIAEAERLFDRAERGVLGRDPLALDLVRLHRCFLDIATGDEGAAFARIEAAQAPRDGAPSLCEVNDDARLLMRSLAKQLTSPAGPRFEVGPDAEWFIPPGGALQSLEKYAAARNILERLVTARLESPGSTISASELFDAGWPGVQINPRSASNRLHVALAKLRKLGLKLVILRHDDGYLLDPGTPCLRRSAL